MTEELAAEVVSSATEVVKYIWLFNTGVNFLTVIVGLFLLRALWSVLSMLTQIWEKLLSDEGGSDER